jgi:ElaB/YqjD/DUF883 family membrane-anchored ribosome-binding protein
MEDLMSNQDVRPDDPASSQSGGVGERIGAVAGAAFSQASDVARDAGAKARDVASETASDVTAQVKDLLDRQIGTSANIAGHLATSARRAADDLADESPFVAGVVRTFADRVEGYADGIKDRTVEELVRTASDFTRRQPALVFGLAALAGFVIFRTARSTPSIAAPPIQPTRPGEGSSSSYQRAG